MRAVLLGLAGMTAVIAALIGALWAAARWAHAQRHTPLTLQDLEQISQTGPQPRPDPGTPDITIVTTTRTERLSEADTLSHTLNDIEAELFAGLVEVLARAMAALDVDWADLAGNWAGVRELAEVP